MTGGQNSVVGRTYFTGAGRWSLASIFGPGTTRRGAWQWDLTEPPIGSNNIEQRLEEECGKEPAIGHNEHQECPKLHIKQHDGGHYALHRR